MTDVTGQVARLSPERQALLQKILREKALAGGSADEIRARPGGGPAPLSFAQRGLWFIHQMDPSGATYHIPYALRLRGPLHADALCRALAEVVRRHESLRTVFRAGDGGEPMQHVLPAECFAVERVDLSDLSHEEAEARLRELADAEAVRPFDLANEPAFRVILARRSDTEHGLFVTLHHIVTDQWSGELLLRETAEGYGALLRGEPIRLPPLPLQYGDYAAWQRQRLGGEVLDRQLAWWKRQLEGIPAVQEIPLDRPRPPVAGSVAGHAAIELSARTSARLRALSHETGATLFATLLAGFQLLLGRWSGSDDVVVGTPVGGRPRVETESIIGYFVNTLAVRARLGGDPTFRTFLLRVRDAVIDAQAHQDVPFDRIVEELTPERSLAYTPIYQTSFSFTPAGTPVTRLGNVELEPLEQRPPAAKFDLGLAMDADESGILRGSFLFRAALFDPETAERLLASLAALLDAASAAPDTPISRLPLLSAEGRREVLERWNGTASGYPRAATAASEFARQAAATPAATALSIGGETMTYAALEARANRIARVLRARGVRHETRVGVSLERSLDLPVVLLAILKAGGAYVPLDPSYPADRLAFMRADAGVELVVARRAHAAWPSLAGAELLVLEDAEDEIASASPEPVDGGATADSLAYVIYTSGSTGTPKGVAVPHRGILRLVRGNGFASMTPDETFLQLAPVAFDASTLELWGPLLNGGRLAIHPPTEPTLESIERAIRGEGVTTLWLTAGLFHLAVDERPGMFTGVRQLLAGGDVLSPAHVARVRRAHPELRLINGYGPTESTTFTACHTVRDGDENGAIPLGSPIADTRVYVAGREMSPVPVGAAGELLIGGDGLARGYLNRPALTAEKFIPDPFSPVPGGRLYRTGDRARWRHDGTLEFLGRLDFQVKIRGFRIEPGEIEAVLRAHPAVGEAVVVVRDDGPGGRRLVAYAASPSTTADELRAHLRGRLPEHMVPAEVVVLPALPLNANGKVDRRALPDPAGLEGEAGDGFVAPRTLTEELMAGIWADVLELDRVSADADFFELGGHSLLATTAVSRVRNAFGVELRLRMLFEAPTPAGLAARVDALRAQGAAAPPPMLPAPRDAALPLSFAQQRLWFLDQVQPGTAQYNVPLAVRTRARLDAGALERALAEVVRRHETLRTAFATVDGEPVQVIGPAAFRLERVDLSPLGAAEREAAARRLAAEEAARPFDLARGPVIRGTLLRLAANDHVLLLTLHHVASDAWSLGVLEREVSALYAAYAAGGESPLEELALQYADFAAWQRAWLSGPVLDAQLEYWRGKLAGVAPLLELPLDRPRPPAQGTEGGVVPLALPAELADRLRALGRREGTTLYMTLLAAFQVVLGRFCGTDDVPVGGPIAGRTRVETEGLIGFFVNTLVLRGDLSADPTFRALLARVRETVLDAHAHQDLPFEKLVEELGVERATTHAPLVQAAFQLLTSAPGAPAGDALRWEPVESAQPNAKFDLLLGVHDEQRALEGSLVYRAELFDEATARRMVDALVHLLHAAVADPDTPVSRLPLLDDAALRQVVETWNATTWDHPRAATAASELARQAAATPAATALSLGGETMTYAALEARANRIARVLRARGVRHETRVGVSLERSLDLPVVLLAILKAGGAYVPLDPSYPADRLAFMRADAGVELVVARRAHAASPSLAGAELLVLEDAEDEIASASPDAIDGGATADSLAYVLYTSGSTGTPKGVAVPHRGILRLVRGNGFASMAADETFLQLAPVAFDASTLELWGPLLNGGRLAIHPPAEPTLESIERAVQGEGVTTLWLTAGLFHLAVDERVEMFAGVRQLLAGGDVLSPAHVARVRRAHPELRLINGYGPTESTTFACCHTVRDGDENGAIPLGGPIGGTRVYVVDARMTPVPAGVAGELLIGGDGLARGYLNRPALTAEKFVPDPFSPVPGGRLYRTGDRARWRPDGTVEFLGRIDQQVKLRGFRIELGEIEAVLAAHPGVRDAAASVREDAPGDRRLVAYVVGDAEHGELRAALAARLPEYMVPAAIVTLDALPLTANGKVDRKALPAPELADAEAFVAPRTPAEEVLAGIWAQVLGMERAGANADFFQLGGHSLLATRAISRVRQAFGVEVPLRALFEAPTPARLAGRIEALRGTDAAAPPLARLPRDGSPLPLSFAQQRLWFIDQLEPGGSGYNIPLAVRTRVRLDADALERALAEVVRRHEALRTVFATVDGEPVQVIGPAAFRLDRADLSPLPPAEREEAVQRIAADEAARPFDLAAGPILRGTLLRLADDDHVLLLTLHHVAGDAWSLGVLEREVSALYAAYAAGGESPLDELPVQYADYAAWQRGWLSGAVLERQLGYWRARLGGAPALLDLPLDRPRPPVQDPRGGSVALVLPPALAEAVRALGRREGATPYMTLLAAYKLLLARLCATDDVTVGSPVAGRTRLETEGLIGFFVNTLVLRTGLAGAPTFRALLGRVRETVLQAHAHQDLPFEKLVEELDVERSTAHTPLFQASFQLLAADPRAAGDADDALAWEPVDAGQATVKFDLTLGFTDDGETIGGALSYRAELFDQATVERFAGHFATLLGAALADPDAPLDRLPLLRPAERAALLRLASGPDVAYDPSLTLHGLFEAQAARAPHAVALTFAGQPLSYAELDARANRLARLLRARGAGVETPVAVFMERSPEMVVALYGILKAGACYVPVDPDYPAERIAWMLGDSGASLVLTQTRLAGALAGGTEAIALDAPGVLDAYGDAPLGRAADPDALAYVIYTSGSTGRPKGAGNTHRGVVNRILWMQETFGLGADDVVLQKTPFSFDVSVWEFFWPLMAGARLAVAAPGAHRDPAALSAEIEAAGVTTLHFVPSMLQLWLDAPRAARRETLRRVISSGEALPADLRDRFFARFPGVELHNLYGPTEAAVDVTWHPCAPGDDAPSVPLGRPVSNTRIHVLDPRGEPCPPGVAGELHIAGAQVGRGYGRRAALTAERFVPDPFAATPGARMYRTGDRARCTAAGVVEYLGRLDFQVKVRGLRVELGEIEAALASDPTVREAAVAARGEGGDARLVAWVVAADGAALSVDALRARLESTLPAYMVPGAVVVLDALPLTPSGKVDRRALPAPGAADAGSFVAPRTPAEELLAGIWADVLGVRGVGADGHFFHLGGHSLLATRVISRVRQAFGVEVPLRALFEAPTPARLAARIAALRGAGAAAPPPLLAVPRDGSPLPLSFAQQRLWFIDRLEPGSSTYNLPLAVRTRVRLDAGALERALAEVVRRHEALRTVFATVDGEPVQVIGPAAFRLDRLDLSPLAAAEREGAVQRIAADEAARPFDLAAGPVIRGTLLRLADDDHVLLLTLHHVTGDAWSTGVLEREVSTLYAAYAAGGESPLAELPVQYADYAAWQRAWMQGEVLEAQLAYWRGRLAGAPPLLELPLDRPRPPVQDPRGASVPIALPAGVGDALRALSRREGTTLYMTLLAAFQLLLGRFADTDDVTVGSPIAGRTRLETEGLIGFFVNTLVLRGDLSGAPTFRAFLAQVRETVLEAHAHQDLPFEKLVEELDVERSSAHTPLFQASFQLLAADPAPAGGDGALAWEPLGAEHPSVKYDLMLGFHDDGAALAGSLSYRAELFDGATAQRMADGLALLLAAAVADPDRPCGELPVTAPAERDRVAAWSEAPVGPAAQAVHAAVAAQARRTPTAAALAAGAHTLTYAEMDARATALARHLRAHGVGAETRVAVMMERSLELPVALLAVLRAGGAYVPLDPGYPAERLAFILADAGAALLLTHRGLAARLPAAGVPVIDLDALPADASGADLPEVPAGALAYVIYTSGSTGTPKGVGIPHGALASHMAWMGRALPLAPADRVLQKTPVSFDASVWEFWAPLMAGATLVMAEPGGHQDPAYLVRAVREEGITILQLVPSMLGAVLEEAELSRCATLRRVLCGGEALPAELASRLHATLRVEVVNLYGPTEATIQSVWHVVGAGAGAVVPIGRPVDSMRAVVVDRNLRPVPPGVAGELLLGGAQLARGYLGRPALTAAAFVPDPFGTAPGGRLYRTGDRARWRADGTLEYLGRTDHQVKLRGFRIEPGEVEAALRAHPSVRDAAVLVRQDAPGDRRLVAYAAGDELDAGALRDHLRARLPEHMVPQAVVVLDRFPLTPNGKLDRRALPAPAAGAGAAHAAPRDAAELALAGIWARVLGVERVGIRDDFFALGGHSLLAVRLLARVERELGHALPLASLFAAPTVERQAALLREHGGDRGAWGPVVTIQPAGEGAPLFFVHGGGGSVLAYGELARALGTRRPFHALQSAGLAGEAAPRRTVEEMAAAYLRALREIHPAGPFVLGGWSMGGLVAFEMALQAQEAGDPAQSLVLVDSTLRGAATPGDDDDARVRRMMAFALHAGIPLDGAVDYGQALRMGDDERLDHLLELARGAGVLPAAFPPGRFHALWNVYRANVAAAAAYVPGGRVSAPVLVVRAADGPLAGADPALGWSAAAAGGVRARAVPGDHFSIVREPHVHALAAQIAEGTLTPNADA